MHVFGDWRTRALAGFAGSMVVCGCTNDAASPHDIDGDAGGSGGQKGGPAGLLDDPSIPQCTISSSTADLRVTGTLAGQPVNIQMIPTSNIQSGELDVLDSYLTDAGYQIRYDLSLKWSGSLTEGVVTPLTGGSVYVPENQPGGGQFYCFSEGEFAPVAPAEQTGTGKLFKFRLRTFSANEDCSGGSVAGSLDGCMYRLNDYLP